MSNPIYPNWLISFQNRVINDEYMISPKIVLFLFCHTDIQKQIDTKNKKSEVVSSQCHSLIKSVFEFCNDRQNVVNKFKFK